MLKSNLPIFNISDEYFTVLPSKSLLASGHKDMILFSSEHFTVLGFTRKSMMNLNAYVWNEEVVKSDLAGLAICAEKNHFLFEH